MSTWYFKQIIFRQLFELLFAVIIWSNLLLSKRNIGLVNALSNVPRSTGANLYCNNGYSLLAWHYIPLTLIRNCQFISTGECRLYTGYIMVWKDALILVIELLLIWIPTVGIQKTTFFLSCYSSLKEICFLRIWKEHGISHWWLLMHPLILFDIIGCWLLSRIVRHYLGTNCWSI